MPVTDTFPFPLPTVTPLPALVVNLAGPSTTFPSPSTEPILISNVIVKGSGVPILDLPLLFSFAEEKLLVSDNESICRFTFSFVIFLS